MDEKQIVDSAKLFIESHFNGDHSGHDAERKIEISVCLCNDV